MDHKREEGHFNQPQSDKSQREFEAWLLKNADSTKADELLFDVLEDCKINSGGERWQAAFELFKKNVGYQSRGNSGRLMPHILLWTQRVAAILFIPLLLLGGYLLYTRNQAVVWDEMFVPYGETRQVLLSDGTTIWLNGGSKLIFPDQFTGNERQVFVTGEAYADVAKDLNQPFVMSVGLGRIEVHGTRFNVKAYGEDDVVEVALFEGSVAFCIGNPHHAEDPVMLKPGEMACYNKLEQRVEVMQHHQDESAIWFEGNNFYFIDKPLEAICKDLTRRFCFDFVFEDPEIAALRYYAVFQNNESLDQILFVLNIQNDLDIQLRGKTYFVSKRKTLIDSR